MRQIVFDTETTGLDPSKGDRLVEIGGVELVNMIPTGNVYHCYLNPQRDMPEEAFRVHGLSAEFLADKPLFEHVVDEFLAFVGDATLVIHNAEFDMRFINTELARLNRAPIPMSQVIDTLALARRRFPGSPASLDALCARFGIDNSRRTKHGALLDSEILAEVYAELTGGRQTALLLGSVAEERAAAAAALVRPRPAPLPSLLTAEEEAAHAAFVETLGPQALWHAFRAPEAIGRTAL